MWSMVVASARWKGSVPGPTARLLHHNLRATAWVRGLGVNRPSRGFFRIVTTPFLVSPHPLQVPFQPCLFRMFQPEWAFPNTHLHRVNSSTLCLKAAGRVVLTLTLAPRVACTPSHLSVHALPPSGTPAPGPLSRPSHLPKLPPAPGPLCSSALSGMLPALSILPRLVPTYPPDFSQHRLSNPEGQAR